MAVAQSWETLYGLHSPHGYSYSFQVASIVSDAVVSAAVPVTWRVRTGVSGHQHHPLDQHTKNKCGSTPRRLKLTVRLSKRKLRWDCRPSLSTTLHSLSPLTPNTKHHRHMYRTEIRSMPQPRSERVQ